MSWTFRNTSNPSHRLAMQVGQLLPPSLNSAARRRGPHRAARHRSCAASGPRHRAPEVRLPRVRARRRPSVGVGASRRGRDSDRRRDRSCTGIEVRCPPLRDGARAYTERALMPMRPRAGPPKLRTPNPPAALLDALDPATARVSGPPTAAPTRPPRPAPPRLWCR